jgi:hypothetical protein
MDELNSLFGTSVELRNTTVERANLDGQSYDRTFAISVLEHLTTASVTEVFSHVHRCLKQAGLFIITLDLFLNLDPFTDRITNKYGRNLSLKEFVSPTAWEVVAGVQSEIYGFPGFNPRTVLSRLDELLIGRDYPTLTQCLVLRKK